VELYPLASIVIPSTKLIPFCIYGNSKKPFQEARKAVERFWKNKGKNLEKRGKVSEKKSG
jgi:hypothetical protein